MNPPPDAVIVDFNPHVIWALISLSIAIVVLLLLLAAAQGGVRK